MFGRKTEAVVSNRITGDAADFFGCKAKDSITGFTGTIGGHTRYFSGCSQVLIIPSVDKDGKCVDAHWFDEQRIELLEEPKLQLDNSRTPGCDIAAPIR